METGWWEAHEQEKGGLGGGQAPAALVLWVTSYQNLICAQDSGLSCQSLPAMWGLEGGRERGGGQALHCKGPELNLL